MESNAMLTPLVLNHRLRGVASVSAKMAGRATGRLVKVRKKTSKPLALYFVGLFLSSTCVSLKLLTEF